MSPQQSYRLRNQSLDFDLAIFRLAQNLKPEARKGSPSSIQGAYTRQRRMISHAYSKPLSVDASAPVLASRAIAINGYTP